ncbi:B12-binding domain-containing radical SAM protein [Patescibacteria group bacterium]
MIESTRSVRVLLVCPQTPDSYWGFSRSLPFINRKASIPPLSLITVAALMPQEWSFQLVDLNVERLKDKQIAKADVVLTSGMIVERESIQAIIERCNKLDKPVIVGGPFVSSDCGAKELEGATALYVGEAEDQQVFGRLINDIYEQTLQKVYQATEFPGLLHSPVPRFDLLRQKTYTSMAFQIVRGCPYKCEFCNVRMLYGTPRYKPAQKAIETLDAIYATGHRGNVFIVDDNLIGNVRRAQEVLEEIVAWQTQHNFPFLFYTQVDVRLPQKEKLLSLMKQAGFFAVFVGYETPSLEALKGASKVQNLKSDPVEGARQMMDNGLMVYAGGIVGFDSDGPGIFKQMLEFINQARIVFPMVGMLSAIPGTELARRKKATNQLVSDWDGNAIGSTNVIPDNLSRLELVRGYCWLQERLYDPVGYFDRAYEALKIWKKGVGRKMGWHEIMAVPKSILWQGVWSRYRMTYWSFMIKTLRLDWKKIPRAFNLAISGHHLIGYTCEVVIPMLKKTEQELSVQISTQL